MYIMSGDLNSFAQYTTLTLSGLDVLAGSGSSNSVDSSSVTSLQELTSMRSNLLDLTLGLTDGAELNRDEGMFVLSVVSSAASASNQLDPTARRDAIQLLTDSTQALNRYGALPEDQADLNLYTMSQVFRSYYDEGSESSASSSSLSSEERELELQALAGSSEALLLNISLGLGKGMIPYQQAHVCFLSLSLSTSWASFCFCPLALLVSMFCVSEVMFVIHDIPLVVFSFMISIYICLSIYTYIDT